MKKKISNRLIAGLISLCMVFCLLPQMVFAAETPNTLGLQWPADMSKFPEWVKYGTQEVRDGIIDAINEEYQRQAKDGYDMGNLQGDGFGLWAGAVTAQFENGDHIGNPWGHENRRWGKIVSPYEGMAFSVKGFFSRDNADEIPLANEIRYRNPRDGSENIYQIFTGSETFYNLEGTGKTGWGYYPGSGLVGNCVNAFKQTYAQSAWYNEAMGGPYHLGCIHQNGKKEGNVVYQEFLGNQSDGRSPEAGRGYDYDFGISYIVAPTTASTEAFIITDDMFTAWTTTWESGKNDKGETEYGKFTNSGAPLGNQYINEDGKVAQDFENFTLVLNDDVYEPTILQAKAEIHNFKVTGGETLQNGTDIFVFIPKGTADIKRLTPIFELTQGAVVDKLSGAVQDFSNTVVYTTTSQTGKKTNYNVTVIETNESEFTEQQKSEAARYANKFKLLNNPLTLEDAKTVSYLENEYWKLDNITKYLAKESFKSLSEVKTSLNSLIEDYGAIKVACVGDSITELYPNYVVPLADLYNADQVAFYAYGRSGYCLSKNGDWSYWDTEQLNTSQNLNPDVVTIMLGTNDSKTRNWIERNCKDTFKDDLKEMVNIYKNLPSKPDVIILASPTVEGEMDTINDPTVKLINAIQKEVAEELDCMFVDLHKLTEFEGSTRDGVHPSDAGCSIMANAISDTINSNLLSTELSKITVDGKELEAGQQYYQVTIKEGQSFPNVVAGISNRYSTLTTEHIPTTTEPYYIFKVSSKLGGYAKKYMVEIVTEKEPSKESSKEPSKEPPKVSDEQQPVKVSKIKISGISKKIAAGKKISLTAEVTPANATDKKVTWKSSNPKYATVDSKGNVSVKKAGAGKSVTITATAADGSGVKETYKISIIKNTVTKITLKANNKTVKANATVKVKAGKKLTLKATVTPSTKVNKTLQWSSSNTKYATVSKKGVVTTKKAGKGKTVKITAKATDGSNKKITVKVKIVK